MGQQEKGETMSEHPGQVDQKPPQSWATLPSGVRYLHTAGTWGFCFVFCSLTLLAAEPSPPPRPLLSTVVLQLVLLFASRCQPRWMPLLSLDTRDQGPGSPSLEVKPHKASGYRCPTSCDPGSPATTPKSQGSPASQQPQLRGPCNVR